MTDSYASAESEDPTRNDGWPSADSSASGGQEAIAANGVGRVAGTEDSTPLQFAVALKPGSYLQLDDVVVAAREVPGIGSVLTSGVVTQVRARYEGASFGSDVFLISDGVLPAQVQEIAEVSTTRVEPEVYVPPQPGEIVRRATNAERSQALYFDQMTTKVPVGLGRDKLPIYINMEFLDGTRHGPLGCQNAQPRCTPQPSSKVTCSPVCRLRTLTYRPSETTPREE